MMNQTQTKPIKITDTILRDAHQSQAATRMRIEDMLPACEILDNMGYWSLECWGGATFDSCMRFLNEDPWERLRTLKKAMPKTPLQMLLRGQNLLGYKHYADDVVEAFCKKSIENGIDVVRIFDALNDPRNVAAAMKYVKEYGGTCEVAISYTTSPVHSIDYFVKLSSQLVEMGADVICIKDMANLLLPFDAYQLVSKLKENLDVPIHLHTHNTSGTGDMTYLMAIQAGVDIVDCALSPLANGTSNPTTEALVATLQGTPYDTGLDLTNLSKAATHFRQVADKLKKEGILDPKVLSVDTNTLLYQVPGGMLSNLISQLKQANAEDKVADKLKKEGILDPKVLSVDTNTLLYQVPGGMLSNLISQLKQANAEDKYYEVLAEVPRVRKDFGYPPLVTPSSQIVGSQAVFNILSGERYKVFTKESKGILRGEYGALPGEVNEEVRRKAIGDDEVITCRPADLLKPELAQLREECKDFAKSEEDVLSYALFPQVAKKFFDIRDGRVAPPEASPSEASEAKKAAPKAATTNDGVRVLYVQDLSEK